MLMPFSHGHAVVLCERRERRRDYDEKMQDVRREKTELAMIHEADGLKKLTKNLKQNTER